jgi:two-component system, sporulation sensor kinase E
VWAAHFPNGTGLIIAVEDEGPGISRDELDGIFEPFFTTKFSGTGLGLSVARSLVDKHGGKIEVESEVGVGTTFFVVLPDPARPADGAERLEA